MNHRPRLLSKDSRPLVLTIGYAVS